MSVYFSRIAFHLTHAYSALYVIIGLLARMLTLFHLRYSEYGCASKAKGDKVYEKTTKKMLSLKKVILKVHWGTNWGF